MIVADSRSTDETVNIARKYSVGIVELANGESRGCGVGVELGYQYSVCEYVLMLDGDMQLQPGFLSTAFAAMEADSRIAGVAGILEDTVIRNKFDRYRKKKGAASIAIDEPWLGGGGLYRRAAIVDAGGYAGNRNLLAYEEAELGLRLRSRGWKLQRLPIPYVKHTGHSLTTLELIFRIWMNGRIKAGGVLLRGALGEPWFIHALRMQVHPLMVLGAWLTFFGALSAGAIYVSLSVLALNAVAFVIQALRRRSISDSFFSLLLWHLSAVGLVQGIFKPYTQPLSKVESRVLVPSRRLKAKFDQPRNGQVQ